MLQQENVCFRTLKGIAYGDKTLKSCMIQHTQTINNTKMKKISNKNCISCRRKTHCIECNIYQTVASVISNAGNGTVSIGGSSKSLNSSIKFASFAPKNKLVAKDR